MRVVRDSHDRPLALETAIGHYVSTSPANPFSVDLIGCIHVADKKYYETLNERFKHYDAVLFELVMPEGGSLENLGKRESNHPIARVQQSLPKILDLDYQLKDIDYTAKNFVHADLSPDEMAKAIKARGDSGGSVFIKVLFDILRESNRQTEAQQKHGGDFAEFATYRGPLRFQPAAGPQTADGRPDGTDGIGNGPWAHARHDPRQGPQRGGHESARAGNQKRDAEDRHLLRRRPHARLRPPADRGTQAPPPIAHLGPRVGFEVGPACRAGSFVGPARRAGY